MLILDSVLQQEKECYLCHRTGGLHSHHVFGAANRKWSEQFGLKIWLCPEHHNMSDQGIHFNKDFDIEVKRRAQARFESEHGHEEFMRIFGRNYL